MRWRGRRQSRNVEDRRGQSFVRSRKGAGSGAMILLILAGLFFGEDVQRVLSFFVGGDTGSGYEQTAQRPQSNPGQNDEAAQFVRVVLAETEDTWNAVFASVNRTYQPPILVLYEDQVQSACGVGSAASGPFIAHAMASSSS